MEGFDPRPLVVLLGCPHGGSRTDGSARGLYRASKELDVRILPSPSSSLLAASFNQILCGALNAFGRGEATHLAFLHADIAPQDGWVDVLMSEMERTNADMVSAISPIKDGYGLTSTGIGFPMMTWTPWKRFAMREIMQLPETFNSADAGYPGLPLLVNSGCWLADLRSHVFHQHTNKGEGLAYFTIRDRTLYRDGQWSYQVEPEDWFFSRCLHALGAVVYATRKVRLLHEGKLHYPNDVAWGEWDHDEVTRSLWSPEEGKDAKDAAA